MKHILVSQKNKGFTIVETLVAVAILMISIAGPLTIAQKGLTAAIYARDQVTASFLAQDAMEIIKNERDNALDSGGFEDWINYISSSCTENNQCQVDTYPNASINPVGCCQLYISDTGIYSSSGEIRTQFSRGFYIKRLPDPNDPNYANEATAFVTVDWRNGTIANVVTLEYEIFNVQR